MTKNEIIKLCENELNYYDIVDECSEMVDFGAIIDFLIEKGIVDFHHSIVMMRGEYKENV